MKYYIDFCTGAGNFYVEGDIEAAKKEAEKYLAYTQKDVKIINENGYEVSRLLWCGTAPDEDETVTAQFGTFGYYGEWIDVF